MKKSSYLIYIISFSLIVLDQISKILIKGFDDFGIFINGFHYGEKINVIGKIVQFTYVENPGMAFSIEFGAGKIFLSLFSILASIILALYIRKINDKPFGYQLSVLLIFAGATGNMIDRVFYGVIYQYGPLFYGKVVDFILVDIPDIHIFGRYYDYFPVFNVADSCVSIGIVLLIFYNKHIPNLSDFRKRKENLDITTSND